MGRDLVHAVLALLVVLLPLAIAGWIVCWTGPARRRRRGRAGRAADADR